MCVCQSHAHRSRTHASTTLRFRGWHVTKAPPHLRTTAHQYCVLTHRSNQRLKHCFHIYVRPMSCFFVSVMKANCDHQWHYNSMHRTSKRMRVELSSGGHAFGHVSAERSGYQVPCGCEVHIVDAGQILGSGVGSLTSRRQRHAQCLHYN